MEATEFAKRYGMNAFIISSNYVNQRKYVVIYEDELDFTDTPTVKSGAPVFERSIVNRLVESYRFVLEHDGINVCRELLDSVQGEESEYASRFGTEYRKSSSNPNDKALMLSDEDKWIESSHYNGELDQEKFLNIGKLRQAIQDYEACH